MPEDRQSKLQYGYTVALVELGCQQIYVDLLSNASSGICRNRIVRVHRRDAETQRKDRHNQKAAPCLLLVFCILVFFSLRTLRLCGDLFLSSLCVLCVSAVRISCSSTIWGRDSFSRPVSTSTGSLCLNPPAFSSASGKSAPRKKHRPLRCACKTL